MIVAVTSNWVILEDNEGVRVGFLLKEYLPNKKNKLDKMNLSMLETKMLSESLSRQLYPIIVHQILNLDDPLLHASDSFINKLANHE